MNVVSVETVLINHMGSRLIIHKWNVDYSVAANLEHFLCRFLTITTHSNHGMSDIKHKKYMFAIFLVNTFTSAPMSVAMVFLQMQRVCIYIEGKVCVHFRYFKLAYWICPFWMTKSHIFSLSEASLWELCIFSLSSLQFHPQFLKAPPAHWSQGFVPPPFWSFPPSLW